jgi:hypothetical protein
MNLVFGPKAKIIFNFEGIFFNMKVNQTKPNSLIVHSEKNGWKMVHSKCAPAYEHKNNSEEKFVT